MSEYQTKTSSSTSTFNVKQKISNTQLELTFNPYKTTSPLDQNCLGKAVFSYFAGGALGFVMAMFMNAVEMREIQIGKVRRSTAIVFRKDFRRMFGTAKGFASFGFFLVLYECMMEHMRVKDDGGNSFLAGFATSVVLGANGMLILTQLFSYEKKITDFFRYRRWVYDVWLLQSLQIIWILIYFIFVLMNYLSLPEFKLLSFIIKSFQKKIQQKNFMSQNQDFRTKQLKRISVNHQPIHKKVSNHIQIQQTPKTTPITTKSLIKQPKPKSHILFKGDPAFYQDSFEIVPLRRTKIFENEDERNNANVNILPPELFEENIEKNQQIVNKLINDQFINKCVRPTKIKNKLQRHAFEEQYYEPNNLETDINFGLIQHQNYSDFHEKSRISEMTQKKIINFNVNPNSHFSSNVTTPTTGFIGQVNSNAIKFNYQTNQPYNPNLLSNKPKETSKTIFINEGGIVQKLIPNQIYNKTSKRMTDYALFKSFENKFQQPSHKFTKPSSLHNNSINSYQSIPQVNDIVFLHANPVMEVSRVMHDNQGLKSSIDHNLQKSQKNQSFIQKVSEQAFREQQNNKRYQSNNEISLFDKILQERQQIFNNQSWGKRPLNMNNQVNNVNSIKSSRNNENLLKQQQEKIKNIHEYQPHIQYDDRNYEDKQSDRNNQIGLENQNQQQFKILRQSSPQKNKKKQIQISNMIIDLKRSKSKQHSPSFHRTISGISLDDKNINKNKKEQSKIDVFKQEKEQFKKQIERETPNPKIVKSKKKNNKKQVKKQLVVQKKFKNKNKKQKDYDIEELIEMDDERNSDQNYVQLQNVSSSESSLPESDDQQKEFSAEQSKNQCQSDDEDLQRFLYKEKEKITNKQKKEKNQKKSEKQRIGNKQKKIKSKQKRKEQHNPKIKKQNLQNIGQQANANQKDNFFSFKNILDPLFQHPSAFQLLNNPNTQYIPHLPPPSFPNQPKQKQQLEKCYFQINRVLYDHLVRYFSNINMNQKRNQMQQNIVNKFDVQLNNDKRKVESLNQNLQLKNKNMKSTQQNNLSNKSLIKDSIISSQTQYHSFTKNNDNFNTSLMDFKSFVFPEQNQQNNKYQIKSNQNNINKTQDENLNYNMINKKITQLSRDFHRQIQSIKSEIYQNQSQIRTLQNTLLICGTKINPIQIQERLQKIKEKNIILRQYQSNLKIKLNENLINEHQKKQKQEQKNVNSHQNQRQNEIENFYKKRLERIKQYNEQLCSKITPNTNIHYSKIY